MHGEPVERNGDAGDERVVRHQEMGGVEVTHAAHQHEHGGERRLAPIERARREPDEKQGEARIEGAREPRGVVHREHRTECLGEERRGDEKQRWLLHERLAGERWNDPVAGLQDVVDEAEGIRLVRLPRLPAEEARGEPHGDEERERDAQAVAGH